MIEATRELVGFVPRQEVKVIFCISASCVLQKKDRIHYGNFCLRYSTSEKNIIVANILRRIFIYAGLFSAALYEPFEEIEEERDRWEK